MSDEAEPIGMAVYPKVDGTWWARVWIASGEVVYEAPTNWNGEGGFYNEGLDDGPFTTVLHRLLPPTAALMDSR